MQHKWQALRFMKHKGTKKPAEAGLPRDYLQGLVVFALFVLVGRSSTVFPSTTYTTPEEKKPFDFIVSAMTKGEYPEYAPKLFFEFTSPQTSIAIDPSSFSQTFFDTTSLNWVDDGSFMSCDISLLANSMAFSSVGLHAVRNKSDEINTIIIFIDATLA